MDRGNRSVSSLRSRMTAPEVMDRIGFLSKRVEELEIAIAAKNKDIRKVRGHQ